MNLKSHIVVYLLLGLGCCIVACSSQRSILLKPQVITVPFTIKEKLTEVEKYNWQYKDIYTDSIIGISLDKVYKELLYDKKGATVIVAVIDSELNIENELFKGRIWENTKEIKGNNVDDDKNGYIDDKNGWNFLGSTERDSLAASTHEAVRIINKFEKEFTNADSIIRRKQNSSDYAKYTRAKKELEIRLNEARENFEYFVGFKKRYNLLSDTLSKVLNNKKITLKKLDSLHESSKDSLLLEKIQSLSYCIKNGINNTWLDDVILMHKINLNKVYNRNYLKDRLTNDNPNDINDVIYGNNNIEGTHTIDHSTEVSSLILSIFNKNIDHNIKIMPIVISTRGSEYDKDIALAIRYAVDNGARIVNMSIGKDFSLNENWILDAIKYAESKNTLIVSAAGNESLNLDSPKVYYYPNDMDINKVEVVNNFLVVGSSNSSKELVSDFSNYGKNTVDIFAPGEEIKVLTRDKITNDSGTSLSTAIVSNLAALILSKYNNLSAFEVKKIILESGLSYDVMVNLPVPYGEETKKVPFSSLSKSGKIVNAYNALLMAAKVSKKKKKQQ